MEILKRTNKDEHSLLNDFSQRDLTRRKFLRFSGLAGATAVVAGSVSLSSCKKDDTDSANGVDLGSGDTGILNYAYALEQ
ncbi:MAG TPA: twin-arginine translocation signal domain-containing protein, partial [Flavisolibacter sp.]|nr:twin-arginine translocation signal domain-containing protein [Flavisolibacter sp.]